MDLLQADFSISFVSDLPTEMRVSVCSPVSSKVRLCLVLMTLTESVCCVHGHMTPQLTVSPLCPGWPGSPSFPGGPLKRSRKFVVMKTCKGSESGAGFRLTENAYIWSFGSGHTHGSLRPLRPLELQVKKKKKWVRRWLNKWIITTTDIITANSIMTVTTQRTRVTYNDKRIFSKQRWF